jgi:hypothetical protein
MSALSREAFVLSQITIFALLHLPAVAHARRGVCRAAHYADIARASSLEVIAVTLEQACERALDFSQFTQMQQGEPI